jgi:uncharacterized protein (TIGR03083 family)
MGMNHDTPRDPVTLDDLVAYALDAHDADDDAAVAAHLRDNPDAVRWEEALRSAAGEFAAAVIDEVAPPDGLRGLALGEARRRRAPAEMVAGASPIEAHRVELSRAVLLLRDLAEQDWSRPVDPPEFAGWTVHDVAVHLAANASLVANNLGAGVPGIPETTADNEGRTAQARARHAGRSPALAVAELEASAEAADRAVSQRGEARLDEPIEWWGGHAATGVVLLIRAFETWTHADDVRRAIGTAMVPPPPPSLLTMAHAAAGFVPSLLAARGAYHPDRLVRFRFTDLPGAAWDVDLGAIGAIRPAGDDPVDAEIVTDAVGFCRGISARLPAGELRRTIAGDEELAEEVVEALPALAVL